MKENPMKKTKAEKGWVITGNYGIYVGWQIFRKDMIKEHTIDLGITWGTARKRGDRCIPVLITPVVRGKRNGK